VARASKARDLPVDQLARVRNEHVKRSLLLQQAFGLRREESLKIQPWKADQGDYLVLKGSWTKGGRPRSIPIRTAAQRALLNEVKAFVRFESASLIPRHKNYAQHLHSYEAQCSRAGLHKMHGLRHAYAQERFFELTGFACPAAGGPTRQVLSAVQREADEDARVIISAELGHGRVAIVATYIGR
jgi:integrase